MSLFATLKAKVEENVNLKDIKHIIKRQKEGKSLTNFCRWAEELYIIKMIHDKKSDEDILKVTEDKVNHFDLKWTDKRLSKFRDKLKKQAAKEPKVKTEKPVTEKKEVKTEPKKEVKAEPKKEVPKEKPAAKK
jgi:hypothetical protein